MNTHKAPTCLIDDLCARRQINNFDPMLFMPKEIINLIRLYLMLSVVFNYGYGENQNVAKNESYGD